MAETIGSLADKIGIAELKIYHMTEQARREDISAAGRDRALATLEVMRRQRDDLVTELSGLLAEVLAGRVQLKMYRQFKMYNDPQYRTPSPSSPGP